MMRGYYSTLRLKANGYTFQWFDGDRIKRFSSRHVHFMPICWEKKQFCGKVANTQRSEIGPYARPGKRNLNV